MVDFNSEATVSASATDILRILILQRRNDVIDAMESYRKIEPNGTSEIIRARMNSLFLEIAAMLKRKMGEDYEPLREKILSEEFKDLLEAFMSINVFLDDQRLTRIDTKQIYDSTRTSKEDEQKGL